MISSRKAAPQNRVLLACGILLATALFAASNHLRTLIDEPVEDLQRSAYDIAEHIGREIALERTSVELIAERLETGGSYANLSDVAKLLLLPKHENLIVAGIEGRQLFNAQFPIDAGAEYEATNEFVAKAMKERTTVVSNLYKGAHTNDWRLSVSTPLIKDERVIGALSTTWSPETIVGLVNQVSLYPGARWSVADRTGRIIALPAFPNRVGTMLPSDLGSGKTIEGAPTWRKSFTVNQTVVRVWAAVPGVDWAVSVIMPADAIMTRVYIWAAIYAVLLFCSLLLVLGITELDQHITALAQSAWKRPGKPAA